MAEPAPAIELKGLWRRFGERLALPELDLTAPPGSTVVVRGPNGSGKTTLLRILAGLLRPGGGEARVLGCELPAETWRLRGRVGYLGHTPMLYRDLTAAENLRFSARLHGLPPDAAEARIAELLERVGMRGRGGDRLAEYSAGMAQRVAACLAVLHDPELLLLDEPEAHLDAAAREAVGGLFAGEGRTRVVASHEREPAGGATITVELG